MIVPIAVLTGCNCANTKYENLANGEVYIINDPETGLTIDSLTQKPVLFYVNLETKDTISGETGLVVNNQIIKTTDGNYEMTKSDLQNEVDEMKAQVDVKIKIDGDEFKIKNANGKVKIDDNEIKTKPNN
jgi:hypothetical protein